MTEAEWITSEDAKQLHRCLVDQFRAKRRKAGRRKLRLFGCASCRLMWGDLTDPRSRAAVEYTEHLADGTGDRERIAEIREGARQAANALDFPVRGREVEHAAALAVFVLTAQHRSDYGECAHQAMRMSVGEADPARYRAWRSQIGALAHLLRDIFGNPFRPAALGRAWLTSDVLSLARQMYESRDFSAMPILANALQEAGCDNDDILSHCRRSGLHVRGCWGVDMVLGKG